MSHLEAYPDDCARIQRVAKAAGYDITLAVACGIWELYSESFAAGWMGLEDDAHILDVVDFHIKFVKMCPHCGQTMPRDR